MNEQTSNKQLTNKINKSPIDQLIENGPKMHKLNALLIHATMSRARMLRPQEQYSEASRSARAIAMRSRAENRRMLGNW